MTRLGDFFVKHSINRASVSRITKIRTSRLFQLSTSPTAHIKADELYKIAKAIHVNPGELLEYVCGDVDEVKEN